MSLCSSPFTRNACVTLAAQTYENLWMCCGQSNAIAKHPPAHSTIHKFPVPGSANRPYICQHGTAHCCTLFQLSSDYIKRCSNRGASAAAREKHVC
jgi:hypothetical protein